MVLALYAHFRENEGWVTASGCSSCPDIGNSDAHMQVHCLMAVDTTGVEHVGLISGLLASARPPVTSRTDFMGHIDTQKIDFHKDMYSSPFTRFMFPVSVTFVPSELRVCHLAPRVNVLAYTSEAVYCQNLG